MLFLVEAHALGSDFHRRRGRQGGRARPRAVPCLALQPTAGCAARLAPAPSSRRRPASAAVLFYRPAATCSKELDSELNAAYASRLHEEADMLGLSMYRCARSMPRRAAGGCCRSLVPEWLQRREPRRR